MRSPQDAVVPFFEKTAPTFRCRNNAFCLFVSGSLVRDSRFVSTTKKHPTMKCAGHLLELSRGPPIPPRFFLRPVRRHRGGDRAHDGRRALRVDRAAGGVLGGGCAGDIPTGAIFFFFFYHSLSSLFRKKRGEGEMEMTCKACISLIFTFFSQYNTNNNFINGAKYAIGSPKYINPGNIQTVHLLAPPPFPRWWRPWVICTP